MRIKNRQLRKAGYTTKTQRRHARKTVRVATSIIQFNLLRARGALKLPTWSLDEELSNYQFDSVDKLKGEPDCRIDFDNTFDFLTWR